MIYLLMAVLSSATMTLVLKYSEVHRFNRYGITTINYVVASLVLILLLIFGNGPPLDLSVTAFFDEWVPVVIQGQGIFSRGAALTWAILTGMAGGVCFCAGLLLIQKSIEQNGVSLTGAFAKLGIVLPLCFALVFWREIPTALQAAGIVTALFAILVINPPFPVNGRMATTGMMTLMALFLASGTGDFMGKVFEKYATGEHKLVFMLLVFFTALCISSVLLLRHSPAGFRMKRRDVIMGILVGVPNLSTSFFLITAFSHIKTTLVFPLFSSGVILLVTLGGTLLFKEHLERRKALAIAMIVAAVVLMNPSAG